MKISNNFKAISKTFIAAVTLSVALSACLKDDNSPQQVSGLAVIHASPGTQPLDFIVDNTKANSNLFSYQTKINYLNIVPGSRLLSVVKKDSTNFLVSQRFDLSSGKTYSIFVIDTLSKKKLLLIEDDLTAPDAGKAKIRFIHLSPDVLALDLSINGNETDLFTNKLFKEYTTFAMIDTGASITFNIKDNATKVVTATVPNVKIEKGKIYTIWANGLKSKTDSTKFGANIYTNK